MNIVKSNYVIQKKWIILDHYHWMGNKKKVKLKDNVI